VRRIAAKLFNPKSDRAGSDPRRSRRWWKRVALDKSAHYTMRLLTMATVGLVPLIAGALLWRAWPILATHRLTSLLFSQAWHPLRGEFGFLPFIMGTLWVTTVAMLLAVPPSLLTAIYLAEYAPVRVQRLANPVIDLLAGIPSVVYGVWGVLVIVPLVGNQILPFVSRHLGALALFRTDNPTGFGVLAGGAVLAVMIFPLIIAVAQDLIRAVPQGLREASLSLGATRWQTVKHVVLRRARAGVVAAVVLGCSRALGETMAVLMVVGNVPQIPRSIFDAAYPLPALIANNYGEMMSVPLYDAALLGSALVLLLVVLGFNVASRLAVMRLVGTN